MGEYSIIICKGCGKKFRIYPHQVYKGDPDYCVECNNETDPIKNLKPYRWCHIT